MIATASVVAPLPPRLLPARRFDELFFVDLPDLDARRAIRAHHLAKRGPTRRATTSAWWREWAPRRRVAALEPAVVDLAALLVRGRTE